MLSRNRNKPKQQQQQHDNDKPKKAKDKKDHPPRKVDLEGAAAPNTLSSSNAANDAVQVATPQSSTYSMPAIYATPTVDTLDDGSLLFRHHRGRNEHEHDSGHVVEKKTEDNEQSGVTRHHVSFTPTSLNSTYSFNDRHYSYSHSASSPTRLKKNIQKSTTVQQQQRTQRRPQTYSTVPRDFQHDENVMTVTVRTVNVAQRSAFLDDNGQVLSKAMEEFHRLAARQRSAHKKLSPSLQYLELLWALQTHSTIRQLAFSPSCGVDADVFGVPWWKEEDTTTGEDTNHNNDKNNNNIDRKKQLLRRRSSLLLAERRDGRYRSIHPVQATVSALPSVPPLLSNKKPRLPMRSDVGFPNVSEEEIQQKQSEIQQETTWEEASPRIVVLVTSDDLGISVQEDVFQPSPDHVEWNGGGLPGMPWAGKELLRAKELSALHFSRKQQPQPQQHASSSEDDKGSITTKKKRLLEPNRTSILAPPLDASYSKTLGWRPRPFHDRPPGMEYVLCWPLEVSFAAKASDLEPLVCSLALYSLPTTTTKTTTTTNKSHSTGVYGKMSEDFTFHAGNWDDKMELDPSLYQHLANANANRSGSGSGSGSNLSVQTEEDWVEAWCKRKQKAIFSFDPLAISGGKASLFWVLQVFKVAHSESAAAYLDVAGNNVSSKRTNSMKKLFQGKSPSKPKIESSSHLQSQEAGANQFYETYGTKFMMPLAYGVTQVYPSASLDASQNESMTFPKGKVQGMTLFAAPSEPESQEDFVHRLSLAAQYHVTGKQPVATGGILTSSSELVSVTSSFSDRSLPNTSSNLTNSSHSDEKEFKSDNTSPPLQKKKSIAKRIFKSPVKASRSIAGTSSTTSSHHLGFSATDSLASTSRFSSKKQGNNDKLQPFKPMAATVELFSSALTVDFLQTMLSEPTDMDGFVLQQHPSTTNQAPKILCDVSGDFAVMLENREMDKRRSSLARLPAHRKPAGYTAISEIREIMYLPARPEKQYDLDIPPSYRSQINLLYLYPRLLRLPVEHSKGNKQKKEPQSRYTVRTRLVRSSVDVDEVNGQVESSNTALDAFHNPSPWAGCTLVKEVYTKVPTELPSTKQGKGADRSLKFEQPMRDELKLRLPLVLDGTFYLQFTLFEIQSEDNNEGSGVSVRAVGENTIPLSSSSMRDSAGGIRVATVIPNGCHRLALGDFKFYVESRLISSIHIGDAAVSAALRDFPVAVPANGDDEKAENIGSVISRFSPSLGNGSALASRPQNDPAYEGRVTFPILFGNASEGTLVGHFQVLLYMHLSNLVDPSGGVEDLQDFMMGNMRSLFQIFRKVKTFSNKSYMAKNNIVGGGPRKRLDVFLKKFLDEFEESFLFPSGYSEDDIDEEQASDMGSDVLDTGSATKEGIEDDNDMDEEILDEGAVRVRHKDSLRTGIDARLTKRGSTAMDITSVSSFSRVAYGASKTDRMKIEAEMYYESGRFTNLPVFDDDDTTVVTNGTYLHNISDLKRKQMAAAALEHQENAAVNFLGIRPEHSADEFHSAGSINAATAAASRIIEEQKQENGNSDAGLAKRVKTVAKVMLQPCVGPTNSMASPRRLTLDCGRSSRQNQRRSPNSVASTKLSAKTEQFDETKHPPEDFVFPGSDDENDDDILRKDSKASKRLSFRGPKDGPTLRFSVTDILRNGNELPVAGGRFVYETLWLLWLRSWYDYAESAASGASTIPRFDAEVKTRGELFDFFHHMDIILPLCLKSLALRYGVEVQPIYEPYEKVLLDKDHMRVLEPFVEMLARCVIGQALTCSSSSSSECDKALLRALTSSELVVEFFVGLLAILHPEQVHRLIRKYFRVLRNSETEHLKENDQGMLEFEWTKETIHRVKSSRQLRLRAVEVLSVLPSFLALNFPLRFADVIGSSSKGAESTWKLQYSDTVEESNHQEKPSLPPKEGKLPESGWLARLLVEEGLSICALSCEAVVAEAMAHMEFAAQSHDKTETAPAPKKRPGSKLKRGDLLMFQSIAVHSITTVYELVLRRHAMDKRFQTDACRGRIASLFAESFFSQSLQSVRWLARMESTHKVRSLWLLCFVYILQEAPEVLIRDLVRSYCDSSEIRIHRFIRLLRLSSSTFQSFVDQPRHSMFPESIDKGISPWLLQESFNTVCATTNIVVEECVKLTAANPKEQRKMMHAVLDLLLHVLTTPQSAVTHLRALGGSLQALEEFGIEIFLDVVGGGNHLQHWLRVVQSLMNSTSLSVRSISVDFVLSLLGSAFDHLGNVDDLLLVFASVLPEVAAREIGLFSVNGHIKDVQDLEAGIWPLRRSFADLEDANPLDDDRIDPELSPVLKTFCRAQQSILDGVLIELSLRKDNCIVVGTKVQVTPLGGRTFDADEESLVEAADFFQPETAPLQRIRWLLTLKSLHEAKGQWIEAAEAMVACARTISDALPHLKNIWRASRFALWRDSRRSIWLETVGQEIGHPDRGNTAVMDFADDFLEPASILHASSPMSASGKLQQPTIADMCKMLAAAAKEAVGLYLREDGMDEVAYARLESLLQIVMNVLVDHSRGGSIRSMSVSARKRYVEEEAALRQVSASLSGDMTKLAQRLLILVQDEPGTPEASKARQKQTFEHEVQKQSFYVLVAISGSKPERFQESTTLPTFLDWNMPCICRVSKSVVDAARKPAGNDFERQVCIEYGRPLQKAISQDRGSDSVVLRVGTGQEDGSRDPSKTYLDISPVHMHVSGLDDPYNDRLSSPLQSNRFFYKKSNKEAQEDNSTPAFSKLVEVTVAQPFPCVMSRQRTLLTSEILSSQR